LAVFPTGFLTLRVTSWCAEPKLTKQQEKAGKGGNAKKAAMKAKRAAKKEDGAGW
jgi:hypothetical protein